jgi:hypothetical protein
MTKLVTLVLFGLSTFALGCGSSNSSAGAGGSSANGGATASGGSTVTSATGGSVAKGGATAAGGSGAKGGATAAGGSGAGGQSSSGGTTASAGGSGGTGSCILPSCLTNLGSSCTPSGDCIVQHSVDTGDANYCYANGVKKLTVLNVAVDYSTDLTVTKSGSTCFTTSYTGNDFFNSAGDLTVKDPSGATVATLSMDLETSTLYIVTCPGAAPVTLDMSCETVWPVSGLTERSSGSCTEGTCTP